MDVNVDTPRVSREDEAKVSREFKILASTSFDWTCNIDVRILGVKSSAPPRYYLRDSKISRAIEF